MPAPESLTLNSQPTQSSSVSSRRDARQKYRPQLSRVVGLVRQNALVIVLTLILACLLYLIFVFFSPFAVIGALRDQSLVRDAAKRASVDPAQFQFMVELGKTNEFKDLEALKAQSVFNQDVYKDAQKGDRVLAFSSKMVIYRNGKIIYDGLSPAQKQAQYQQQQVENAHQAMKAEGLVKNDEVPQLAVVVDRTKLGDDLFFAKAENGDFLLAYEKANVFAIYRPDTKKIVAQRPLITAQSSDSRVSASQKGTSTVEGATAQESGE
jgi:hypothetical protein